MTARAVSVVRGAPEVTRETVFSFIWMHSDPPIRGYCCGLAGVDLMHAQLSWDELDPSDRESLRDSLHDLLTGHELRREEYRERKARAGR